MKYYEYLVQDQMNTGKVFTAWSTNIISVQQILYHTDGLNYVVLAVLRQTEG